MSLSNRVLKFLLLHDSPSQETIARDLEVDRTAVARELSKLCDAGLVELCRFGQKQIPRLKLFTALEGLENALRDFRGAA